MSVHNLYQETLLNLISAVIDEDQGTCDDRMGNRLEQQIQHSRFLGLQLQTNTCTQFNLSCFKPKLHQQSQKTPDRRECLSFQVPKSELRLLPMLIHFFPSESTKDTNSQSQCVLYSEVMCPGLASLEWRPTSP